MFIPKVLYIFILIGVALVGIANIAAYITMSYRDHKKKNEDKPKDDTQ